MLVIALTALAVPHRLASLIPSAEAASANIVISQVYGGGGNSGSQFTNDFIELFNRGNTTVSLNGWSIQYTSAGSTAANFGSATNLITPLSGSLAPGQYMLIREAAGTNNTGNLPTPDITDSTPIAMSAGDAKVALVNTTTPLGCNGGNTPCTGAALASIVDLVGYGSATFFEGAAAPGLTNSTAIFRDGGGCVDTDNNAADFASAVPPNSPAAPNPRNSASPTNPCTSDSAPSVATVSPVNGATNVGVNSSISVTFSEPVNVSGSWFTISCATSGSHTAAVSGGPTAFTLDPDSDFANGETCTVTVLASQVTDQDIADPPDQMAANYVFSFTTVAADPCASAFTPIYQIQGSGPVNTVLNSVVTTKGVVTADFQGSTGLNGFFIQDPTGDGNTATSDGVFVFGSSGPAATTNVSVGDLVVVKGRAAEFNTLTEIDQVTAVSVCPGGATVPAPVVVSMPEPVNNDFERYEGMLVTIPETMTVGQNFFQGRFGQVTLSSGGRLYNPTNLFPAGSPQAVAMTDENARRLLVLDDGSGAQNPNPIPYLGADNTLRAGDTVTGLTGVIDFGPINSNTAIRDYRMHPTVTPSFSRDNPRTAAPGAVGGNVKVASFNVLNYFNGNGLGGGFPTSRGANTLAEFNRQRDKIIAAIAAIDADVIGVIEMENDGGGPTSAVQNLVNGLNAAVGAGTYAGIVGPAPGTDEIQTAFIYKPGRLTPVGAPVNYSDLPSPNNTFEREPLAQTFTYNANGEKFTAVINHLKSKSSCPASGPDADQGDGQGCWNARRVTQAQALLGFIASVQAGSGDPDVVVLGDMNSYGKEDPILKLTNGGLVDTIAAHIGDEAYSYVFDGQAGYLDHALATPSMAAQVSGVSEWHINADEPSVIDYNTEFKPPSPDLYTPTPYRSSDHDPVVVGLNLNAPPTAEAGGPYAVAEGGSVALGGSGTDPDGDALTVDWDLDNDGNFETLNQPTATFSAAGLDGPSSKTVNVRVTDTAGHFATDSATVSVTNAAPVVGALSATPSVVGLGGAVNAGASFTDAGTPDTHTASINWGDGNTTPASVTEAAGSGSAAGSHTYAAPGAYTVTLTVVDDDGDSHTSSTTVTVQYGVVALYDQSKVNKAGSTIPVKLQVTDGAGNNVSSPALVVTALGISQVSNATVGDLAETSSTANPDNDFRYDASLAGYIFNLRTKGLAAGTYYLYFQVGGDPTLHTVSFQVR